MSTADTRGPGHLFPQKQNIVRHMNGVGNSDMPSPKVLAEAFNAGVESAVESRVAVDFHVKAKKLAAVYEIRSYNETYHPDLFRGGGVLGFAIRVLNFLRWKLEVLVQYLALQYWMRQQNFSLKSRQKVLDVFKLDVIKEKVEFYERSPLRAPLLPPAPPPDTSSNSGAVVPTDGEMRDGWKVPGRDMIHFIREFGPKSRRRLNRTHYTPLDMFDALPPEEGEEQKEPGQ